MGFVDFLKYGGLGVVALLCVIVLFYNARNLNALVKDADATRVSAARGLLQMQMAISLVGLLVVGGGAMYLAYVEQTTKQDNCAEIVMDPGEAVNGEGRAQIVIDDAPFLGKDGAIPRNIPLSFVRGKERKININIEPYVVHRLTNALKEQKELIPVAASGGIAEPGS
jgi:hypothetical protein